MAKYRIVRDAYCGYEVQLWRWWFPFWVQCGFTNTHPSVERAKMMIDLMSDKRAIHYDPITKKSTGDLTSNR